MSRRKSARQLQSSSLTWSHLNHTRSDRQCQWQESGRLSWVLRPWITRETSSRSRQGLWSPLTRRTCSGLITWVLAGRPSRAVGQGLLPFLVTSCSHTSEHLVTQQLSTGEGERATRGEPVSLTEAWRGVRHLNARPLGQPHSRGWRARDTDGLQRALPGTRGQPLAAGCSIWKLGQEHPDESSEQKWE